MKRKVEKHRGRLAVPWILSLALASVSCIASSAMAFDGPPEEVHGQVLLSDGAPAAGVPVIVYFRSLLAETKTDADGDFQLRLDPQQVLRQAGVERWANVSVAAFAKGYGPDWIELADVEPNQPVTLRLVQDQPITGRILDQQGRPVVGASIRALWLHDQNGNADGFLQATRDTPSDTELQSYTQHSMRYLKPGLVRWVHDRAGEAEYEVTTDKEGRFEMAGFGRERSVGVKLTGPGIASKLGFIVTRPEIGERWRRGSLSRNTKLYLESGATIPPIWSADFTCLADPGLTIRGTLRDAKTGQPVEGMAVHASMRPTSASNYVRETGPDGKYEIHGMSLEGTLKVSALNVGSGPYLDARKELLVTGDSSPGAIDLSLDRGTRVWGKVLDENGEPVEGNVGYLAWVENPQLEDLSETYDTFNTQSPDEEGNYSIIVPPGPGVLTFSARDRQKYSPAKNEDFGLPLKEMDARPVFYSQNMGYVRASLFTVVQRIEPNRSDTELQVELTVQSGDPVVGRLVTSEGDPVRPFRARGLTSFGLERRQDGIFRVRGLKAGETRRVFFMSADGNWAAIEEFTTADADQSHVVKMQRTGTVRARLTDADGKPLSEWIYAAGSQGMIEATKDRNVRPTGLFEFAEGVADADGFLYIKSIPANVHVEIAAAERPRGNPPQIKPVLVKELRLRPGQDLDLGEVRLDVKQ